MMKKIIAVVGARPQFIKHAAVDVAFKSHFELKTVHTGQHYDAKMSEVFFEQLQISKPDFMLQVGSHSHGVQTGKMMIDLEKIFIEEQPDAVLVYGDTNSTLAAALVASKLQQQIIHIEAGLRSFNRAMPEEINRVLTDHLSALLFAPTAQAVENLRAEGISRGVFLSADVMSDTILMAQRLLKNSPKTADFYYATIHRPSNTDEPQQLQTILNQLNSLDKKVILATHPRTQSKMQSFGIDGQKLQNIQFIEPVDYLQNVAYMSECSCLITDSGGMQKEAYMLGKKCVTLRAETEWVETLQNGCNLLAGARLEQLPELVKLPIGEFIPNLYGDGKAAESIAQQILANL